MSHARRQPAPVDENAATLLERSQRLLADTTVFLRKQKQEEQDAWTEARIRAGATETITDRDALDTLWRRYAHDPIRLSTAIGDYYTARAHTHLTALAARHTSVLISISNPITSAALAAETIACSSIVGSRTRA